MADLLYRILELEVVNTWVQALETNVQAARDRLRDHQEKFENLFKEVHSVSDWCISWINEESLYWTSLPNNSQRERWLWRENRIMHVDSTHYLVITKILNLLGGFVDTRRPIQSVKSESHVVLIRYRHRPCRAEDLALGL